AKKLYGTEKVFNGILRIDDLLISQCPANLGHSNLLAAGLVQLLEIDDGKYSDGFHYKTVEGRTNRGVKRKS
ncbi:hypothetical protein PFISCL1PPCAC_17559, partial [Pristionchus fissidentatus]